MIMVELAGGRSWASSTRRGDGTWYLHIAENGYSIGRALGDASFYSAKSDLVFYPALPALTRLFSLTGLSTHNSAVLVTSGASVLTTIWVYKYLLLNYSNKISLTTALLWIAQPFAVVLTTVLTESLFALFTILTLYFWKTNQKYLASIFLLADCLTRTTGAAIAGTVLLVYLNDLLKNHGHWKKLAKPDLTFILIAFIGPLLWPLYVGCRIQRIDGYFYLQGEQWNSKFDGGVSWIQKTVQIINPFDSYLPTVRTIYAAVGCLFGLFLLVLVLRLAAPKEIKFVSVLTLVMGFGQASWYTVKQRYLVPCYFLYLPVAKWLINRSRPTQFLFGFFWILGSLVTTWWMSMYYPKWF